MSKFSKNRVTTTKLNLLDFALLAIGVISTSSIATWVVTGSTTRTETSDKLTYLAAGLAAAIVGIIALRRSITSSGLSK